MPTEGDPPAAVARLGERLRCNNARLRQMGGEIKKKLFAFYLREQVIPSQTITSAIISTSCVKQRQRILYTHVVVALVIAMSFWSSDSVVSVFKNLIHGLACLRIKDLIRFQTPTSSSITEAGQRTGAFVMTRLFEMVNKPFFLGAKCEPPTSAATC
jgi:hypothetical protein